MSRRSAAEMAELWEMILLCSHHDGAALRLLQGYALHADADGLAWPGDDRLARLARPATEPPLSRSGLRKVRQRLVDSGELLPVEPSRGRGHPAKYGINLDLLQARAARAEAGTDGPEYAHQP